VASISWAVVVRDLWLTTDGEGFSRVQGKEDWSQYRDASYTTQQQMLGDGTGKKENAESAVM